MIMKNRFEISTEGMRLLHDGRPLWQLVKELIANCWDEEISFSKVSINSTKLKGVIEIVVEDDGKGFLDIADSWTLMKPTPKRSNASVRGRYNIGEKELLSIAREATIETVGHTVKFPTEGGRKNRKNDRKQGTKITTTVRGKQDEIQTTMDMLRNFIAPDGIDYTLSSNHVEPLPVHHRERVASFEATLKTTLASGINEPIRNTSRKTNINVYRPIKDQGSIFEMGIYIQPTDMPYDVDIGQKVPLPPNRDVVSTAYLQDVYAEVLDRVKEEIDTEFATASWINLALEDDRTSKETISVIRSKQLGDDAVLWSPDEEANEAARLAGKDVIHSRTLNPIVRDKFKDDGLQTTHEVFGTPSSDFGGGDEIQFAEELTVDMLKVENYAKWLAKELLNVDCSVTFANNPQSGVLAWYKSESNRLTFNVGRLGKPWFQNCPSLEQTRLIVHEVGHANPGVLPHTGGYIDTLIEMATVSIHNNFKITGIPV